MRRSDADIAGQSGFSGFSADAGVSAAAARRNGAALNEPSIQAVAFQGLVDDVARLRHTGQISEEELEKYLMEEDRELLDSRVLERHWYPMHQYGRFIELVVAKEARGRRTEYLVERGRRAAERLLMRIDAQYELQGEPWGPTVTSLLTPLASMIHNYTDWQVEIVEPTRRYRAHVAASAEFPEPARYTTQGFIQHFVSVVTRAAGGPVRVTSQRIDARQVKYLIEKDD
jgi:hypothetical protein